MLMKYAVTFYRGMEIPIFLFEIDQESNFVEKYVVDLFDCNQCKKIKNPNHFSAVFDLEGAFYDCCHRPNEVRVTLSIKYRLVTIMCEKLKLEFRLEESDLHLISYKEYEFIMKANEGFKVNLIFSSSKNKMNKEYYVGYAHVTEVIK